MVFAWYMYAILDIRWYTWPYYIPDSSTDWLLYCSFMCCMLFLILVFFYSSNIVCSHDTYTCTFPSFYHSFGHFLTTLDLHIQVHDVLFLWPGVDELYALWWVRVSFYLILVFMFIFVPIDSLILYMSYSVSIPFLYSFVIMCRIYMSCYSDLIIFIVELYNLFELF